MKEEITPIEEGSVTTPRGFLASGVACGIKARGEMDLALVCSERSGRVVGLFTENRVAAAPVLLSRRHAALGVGRAVILNSGNANACTGATGMADATEMAERVASGIGCPTEEVFVCSTGRIGVPLPMGKVRKGIDQALGRLSPQGGSDAALGILTTDTYPKKMGLKVGLGEQEIFLGGIAKGAGMIDPHLATMLCVITTDADLSSEALQVAARRAVAESFNRISIDGDCSTNDTVLVLANGLARNPTVTLESGEFRLFQSALSLLMGRLARMIVEDGEGISKVVEILIEGASDEGDAERAARAVAHSLLVKCSWHGEDPNWGRLMAAIGYSGAAVDKDRVDIFYNGVQAVSRGERAGTAGRLLREVVRLPQFTILIDLGIGSGHFRLLTTDLTERYVRLNKGE
ncbi:glutamate N-acetyltransferase / amino-acid N-acetyltransferase [Methylacidimicrobium cyclopophantes]|uniref:Arginine biosynthesis bifunctional protein ArgJ n=1 Tax=Methylacidimicrobium cyclopophantes TaxID=1041766 RepID=A0A5E6MCE1_9BACT|nr:bifunctional glutamate N-acetyltransferase/amino-acid acetyltransferase ArgJ [Methylacidimicrobium cyclopophantes]VVM05431.1 glutamate N-acetyltransferase / amino-acid N-acetyltransferase [Methylacidimicrobium cyclopophantes]